MIRIINKRVNCQAHFQLGLSARMGLKGVAARLEKHSETALRDKAQRTVSGPPGSAGKAEAAGVPADIRWLAAACGLLLGLKIWFAWRLDLFSDEVFYWLAATEPAIAYSDLPFLTALLAGAGSALDPGNPLATRSLFLAGGACLPAAVYWLALPLKGRRDALQAALLSICLPLGGFLGLLAVPDVPMLLLGLLSLGCLDRALRHDRSRHWLGFGVCMALGLCSHYRFLPYPAGAAAFLLFCQLSSGNTRHWRNPKLWLAAAIAALGLLPLAWANLFANLDSASFYFIERHPWRFHAAGLLHIPVQALLVTPPLYALLLYSAWLTYQAGIPRNANNTGDANQINAANSWDNYSWDTRAPNRRHAQLLLWFSLPHLLVYAALAPWADAGSTSAHWPLPGYFPLLVFAPEALRRMRGWLRRQLRPRSADAAARAIPAIGFAGALLAVAGIGSQSLQDELQPVFGEGVLSEKMAGWPEFNEHTSALLESAFGAAPVVVTDNYPTAAQLQYAGTAGGAYTLDTDKAVRDGRLRQLEIWRRTEAFIRQRAGESMLFITEDSALDVERKHALIAQACGLVDALEQIDQLSLFQGDKRFSYYRGESILAIGGDGARPCPFPPRAWLDAPAPGAELTGLAVVGGWAYNEDLGVARVRLYLDGEPIGEAEYGLPRPDVVAATGLRSDPNQPNLGFQASIDTAEFKAGGHELAIGIIDSRGFETIYGHRGINFTGGQP